MLAGVTVAPIFSHSGRTANTFFVFLFSKCRLLDLWRVSRFFFQQWWRTSVLPYATGRLFVVSGSLESCPAAAREGAFTGASVSMEDIAEPAACEATPLDVFNSFSFYFIFIFCNRRNPRSVGCGFPPIPRLENISPKSSQGLHKALDELEPDLLDTPLSDLWRQEAEHHFE